MKPQDFLIGVRDFFAMLIPGVVLLILLNVPVDDGEAATIELLGFMIGAYLCGAVASGTGSVLDNIVDLVLGIPAMRSRLFRRLADREALAEKLRDQIIQSCLKDPQLPQYPESVKSFWWDHLRLNCSPAILELDRREAFQKLFRSLSAVFLFLIVLALAPRFTIDEIGLTQPDAEDLFPLTVAAILAVSAYAGGRYIFQNAVYRLGAAYCLSQCDEGHSAAATGTAD